MGLSVSVIVPVYNVEQYLPECIDSILMQTFTDFECILVDDCSTDNSPVICDEYAQKDNRIKVIHNIENIGVSLSRRKGLTVSQGNYIQYIDSDDWLEREMFEILYQKAVSENFDMVVCDCFREEGNTQKIYKQNFTSFDKIAIIKNILSYRINTYLFNKLVKKELYLCAEFPEYNHSEDYVITIQNIYNSGKIGYVDIPLYHYRYNPKSLSNNIEKKINGRIEENKNWHKVVDFLKEKYGNIKIFEPELSNHINEFKDIYMSDKKLRRIKELFELYPESHYFLKSIIKKSKKLIKMILPKKAVEVIKARIK